MSTFEIHKFQKSRIATIDVCQMGKKKNHVAVFLEIDVTKSREKIRRYKKEGGKISFLAWLIKVIGQSVNENKSTTAFLQGKRKTIIFNDINISLMIEKELNGEKFPLPVLIEKANTLKIETITKELIDSKNKSITIDDVVIGRKTTGFEKLYYNLPGFVRKLIWRVLLKHPKMVFPQMGNVAITSLGMFGKINGWFIPASIHPLCFGIGSIIKKPVVVNDKIEIREILNMTVLLDHDVIDGAQMARFISFLTKNIEKGVLL
jgi:pyruvate/2-oxoglutarate dehydrogenase complex dihydrolipoamide acyltransferase (E2) component